MAHSRKSQKIQEYLRKLGNPYASLSIFDDVEDAYRDLGNPYAKLSQSKEEVVLPRSDHTSLQDRRSRGISKDAFEKECRHVFQQYMPQGNRGGLRPHHRAFIERNKSRSPMARATMLDALRKYDLSDLGVTSQFNRERDMLTTAKLREIEKLAEGL